MAAQTTDADPRAYIKAGLGLALVFVEWIGTRLCGQRCGILAGPILDAGRDFYLLACVTDHAASRKYWPVISSKTS